MQPKLPEKPEFFGKNHYTLPQKGQRYNISPNGETTEKIRKKTESITFRLENEILVSLRQEARRKDVA